MSCAFTSDPQIKDYNELFLQTHFQKQKQTKFPALTQTSVTFGSYENLEGIGTMTRRQFQGWEGRCIT